MGQKREIVLSRGKRRAKRVSGVDVEGSNRKQQRRERDGGRTGRRAEQTKATSVAWFLLRMLSRVLTHAGFKAAGDVLVLERALHKSLLGVIPFTNRVQFLSPWR